MADTSFWDPALLKPYTNPVTHTTLSPDLPASIRAGKPYLSIESEDEEIFPDDERVAERLAAKRPARLASGSEGQEEEHDDNDEWEDGDNPFQTQDSRDYQPEDDEGDTEDGEEGEDGDEDEDDEDGEDVEDDELDSSDESVTPRQVSLDTESNSMQI